MTLKLSEGLVARLLLPAPSVLPCSFVSGPKGVGRVAEEVNPRRWPSRSLVASHPLAPTQLTRSNAHAVQGSSSGEPLERQPR